jgi:hypothetical protein
VTAEAVILRYQAQFASMRSNSARIAAQTWAQNGGVTDAAAEQFIQAVSPVAKAARQGTVRLVTGYNETLLRQVTGTATPIDIDAEGVASSLRNNLSLEDEFLRPIIEARTAILNGKTLTEALTAGRNRASDLMETDVLLAQRDAMSEIADKEPRIVGYSRVITGRSCGFCATASTQRYTIEDLMPIHDHCDCSVAPIIGTEDPGRVINRQLVRDLRSAARQTTGSGQGYWKNRHVEVDEDGTVHIKQPAVREHGELGPVLQDPGHSFTGPGGIAA